MSAVLTFFFNEQNYQEKKKKRRQQYSLRAYQCILTHAHTDFRDEMFVILLHEPALVRHTLVVTKEQYKASYIGALVCSIHQKSEVSDAAFFVGGCCISFSPTHNKHKGSHHGDTHLEVEKLVIL